MQYSSRHHHLFRGFQASFGRVSVKSAIQDVQRLVRSAYLAVVLIVQIDGVNAVLGALWREFIEAVIFSVIYAVYI